MLMNLARAGLEHWCQVLDIAPGDYVDRILYAPVRLKQVMDGGLTLARLAGRMDRAMAFLAQSETELATLHRQKGIDRRMPAQLRRPIVVIAGTDPLQVTGAWIRDVVELAGGRLTVDAGDEVARTVRADDIPGSAPELVLTPAALRLPEGIVVHVDPGLIEMLLVPGPELYGCIRRLAVLITP